MQAVQMTDALSQHPSSLVVIRTTAAAWDRYRTLDCLQVGVTVCLQWGRGRGWWDNNDQHESWNLQRTLFLDIFINITSTACNIATLYCFRAQLAPPVCYRKARDIHRQIFCLKNITMLDFSVSQSFLWRKDKILYTQEKPSKSYLMYADNEIM